MRLRGIVARSALHFHCPCFTFESGKCCTCRTSRYEPFAEVLPSAGRSKTCGVPQAIADTRTVAP